MATTLHWLPGWPATRPRRRAARTRAIPAPSGTSLARGERALLTAEGVIATDRACYHDPGGEGEWTRLGWEQVVRADPHDGGLVLTTWAPGLPARLVLAVPRPARLLAFARERVAWTTLLTTRIPLGDRWAQATARRRPGTGELVWLVVHDTPLAPTDEPALAAALARLRGDLG